MGVEMAWEKGGRYYTRSKRVGGHVVREYVGGGAVGALVAEDDRKERGAQRQARVRMKAEWTVAMSEEKALVKYCDAVDALLAKALEASGYHNHRGRWRLRRGTKKTGN